MKKRGRPKGTTEAGLKYLDEGQLKAFFQAIRKTKDAVRKTRDDLIFSLIVFYGLRVSELAGLKMGDLDPRARQLRVAAAKGGSKSNGAGAAEKERERIGRATGIRTPV